MRILSRKYTFFLVKLESLKAVWRMHLSRPQFEHQKKKCSLKPKSLLDADMVFCFLRFTWKLAKIFFVSDGVISDHAIETGFD